MGKVPSSYDVTLSNLKTNFNLGYTFLPRLWAEAVVLIEVLIRSAPLALASKILDSCNHICDIESLDRG